MLRSLAVAAALVALAGCSSRPRMVRNQSIDRLEASAAAHIGCTPDDTVSVPLTLLTRVVQGCNRSAVYAYDWMHDVWVPDRAQSTRRAMPGPRAAERSGADEFRGPHR